MLSFPEELKFCDVSSVRFFEKEVRRRKQKEASEGTRESVSFLLRTTDTSIGKGKSYVGVGTMKD